MSSMTRDLLYYKNPDTDDCSGGVPRPANKYDLRCDILCQEGTYLPPGTEECADCPSGSYTIGGGDYITDWTPFPALGESGQLTFESFATIIKSAAGVEEKFDCDACKWNVTDGGMSIQSGKIGNFQRSKLQVNALLVMDGSVSFYYRVDAEPNYDGLVFSIDGVEVLSLVSTQQLPALFTAPLTRGFHTLTWSYQKDIWGEHGSDTTWISDLKVLGTTFSDDECHLCPAGTFAESVASGSCASCPRNTFADSEGSSSCKPCADDEYSLEGATKCEKRGACSSKDYTFTYTNCQWREDEKRFIREKHYAWLPTTTCNTKGTSLPPDEVGIPCSACSSGLYRSKDTGFCVSCPAGSSVSEDGAGCTECPAGTEAAPAVNVTHWDKWEELPGFSTGCEGSCGTDGWVLSEDGINSGTSHGPNVDSWLEFVVTAERMTEMRLLVTLTTVNMYDTRLQIVDEGHSTYTVWDTEREWVSFTLEPGLHHFSVLFTKRNQESTITSDQAIIHAIEIPNAVIGSYRASSTCAPCPAGSYSAGNDDFCDVCSAGTSSEAGSPSCDPCPVDTFNDVAGGVCKSCGPNNHAPEGSVDCDNTCVYHSEFGDDIVYDLSPLQRFTEMYGPVHDDRGFLYYFNLCSRFTGTNETSPCLDENGNPMVTMACQTQPCVFGRLCRDYNIGNMSGFYPLDNPNLTSNLVDVNRSGFVLAYTNGVIGCGGVSRTTNISFICNPSVGIGSPTLLPWRGAEGPVCHYEFLWESEYGCPLCTSHDYGYIYGECRNNTRRKMYYWKANPRLCHHGVSLPPDENITANCSGQLICPPGYSVDTETESCVPCSAGSYSPGAGNVYSRFTSFPTQFATSCENIDPRTTTACKAFTADQMALSSGTENSVLTYTSRFHTAGNISFSYKALFPADDVNFTFAIDGKIVYVRNASSSVYSPFQSIQKDIASFDVPVGGHVFTWSFHSPDTYTDLAFLRLYTIETFGDAFAPTSCTACPSGYHQPLSGQHSCIRCPSGTISGPGFFTCQSCTDENKVTYDGLTCEVVPLCTESDWQKLYGECDPATGNVTITYKPLTPKMCYDGYVPHDETVPCLPCPPSTWRDSTTGLCVGCPAGKILSESGTSEADCVSPPVGSVSLSYRRFFSEGAMEASLPQGWTTESFEGSNPDDLYSGWRLTSEGIDSGSALPGSFHVSRLAYTVQDKMVGSGKLSFEYKIVGTQSSGSQSDALLVVIVNGVPVYFASYGFGNQFNLAVPEGFKLNPEGPNVFEFIAHIPASSTSSADSISENDVRFIMRNVDIYGITGSETSSVICDWGSQANTESTMCIPCEPGTYNGASGAASCLDCPSGTFSDIKGSTYCTACGAGTTPEKDVGSSRCVTDCMFYDEARKVKYNVSGLSATGIIGPVEFGVGKSLPFYFSICDGVFPAGSACGNNTEPIYRHVCRADGENFGSRLAFTPSTANETEASFILSFTTPFTGTYVCPEGRSTTIIFRCSPSAGHGFPVALGFDPNSCDASFSWASEAGCHVCDPNNTQDYKEVTTACVSRSQRVELHRVGSCNGPARVHVRVQRCLDISIPIGAAAGALVFLIILAVAVGFVVWKNRKLTYKYTKLLQDQAADLEAMADDDGSKTKNAFM